MQNCRMLTCFIIGLLGVFSSAQQASYSSFGPKTNESDYSSRKMGTSYNTYIKDDNVNVRNIPSLRGEVLGKLNRNYPIEIIGVSSEKDYIDNYSGYWFSIRVNEEGIGGWVFSKYINFDHVFSTGIAIVGVKSNQQGDYLLQGNYMLGGKIIEFAVAAYKQEQQDFYVFSWDLSQSNFHYSNIPGCYLWYPKLKKLTHLSYLSTSSFERGYSLWTIVNDDLSFMIKDFGTAPLPREVVVWSLAKNTIIYNGLYYDPIKIIKDTINVVYKYRVLYDGKWEDEESDLPKDAAEYGRNYLISEPPSSEMLNKAHAAGIGICLLVECKYSLNDQTLSIIGAKYIEVQ